jgi:hypothetical protein
MISTNTVFDMLPSVVVLYDKLGIDEYRKKISQENKGKKNVDSELLGIDLFKYVLKNSAKVKEEVFEIVSIFEEKTIEEVKAQSFMKTFNTLKVIFSDTETTDFFKSAMSSDTPKQ